MMTMKKYALFLAYLSSAAFMGCELAEPDLSKCTTSNNYCDGNTSNYCLNGRMTDRTCPDGCDNNTGRCIGEDVGVTKYNCPVEMFCSGNELYICDEGSFSKRTCPSGCDAVAKDCKIEDGKDCAIDKCDTEDNKKIYKCKDGIFTDTPEDCPDGFICKAGRCIKNNAECINDKCEDNHKIKKCIDGQWGETTSCEDPTPICSTNSVTKEGSCVDNCKDKCLGEKIQKCNGDGNLLDAVSCPNDEVCKETNAGAACTAKDKECVPGTIKCSDTTNEPNTYQKCNNDGKWDVAAMPCPKDKPVCTGEDGKAECKEMEKPEPECKDGETKCKDDNTYIICEDGKWNVSKLRVCPKDKPICTDEDGNAKCKEMETPKPECKDGETKCKDGNTYIICLAGLWNVSKLLVCPNDKPICTDEDGNAKCKEMETPKPECKDGETKCNKDNTGYSECLGGQWAMSRICPTDKPVCTGEDGNAECIAAVCNIGEFRCIPSLFKGQENLEYCDGTGWKQVDTCNIINININKNPRWCNAELGACVKACDSTTTESVCMTNDIFECKDGLFVNGRSCLRVCDEINNKATCKGETSSCMEGETKCDLASVLVCKSNTWMIKTWCAKSEMCVSGIKAGLSYVGCKIKLCTNGVIQCNEDGNSLMQCNNNEWIRIGQCKEGFVCSGGKCVAK